MKTPAPDPRRIPPGQQLVAPGKWPIIGERLPRESSAPWSLTMGGMTDSPVTFSLEQIYSWPQTSQTLDIHCVTRWSRLDVTFSGVLLADLLNQIDFDSDAKFVSFVSRSNRNHSSSLPLDVAVAQNTLIATHVDGELLGTDHGGPIRNIVSGRYFYKSVKWLERIDLLAEDRLGMWEAQSGYHNNADPWLEQRYMAPQLDRREAMALIVNRDFSNRDLRSIDCSQRDLTGLNAKNSQLRDGNFRDCILVNANFSTANLSNAHLERANLASATFVHADLEGANLAGANLSGADLTGASLIGATFVQADAGTPILAAQFDNTTILPTAIRETLTPEQRDFVDRACPNDF